jgi:hypothetical protein
MGYLFSLGLILGFLAISRTVSISPVRAHQKTGWPASRCFSDFDEAIATGSRLLLARDENMVEAAGVEPASQAKLPAATTCLVGRFS